MSPSETDDVPMDDAADGDTATSLSEEKHDTGDAKEEDKESDAADVEDIAIEALPPADDAAANPEPEEKPQEETADDKGNDGEEAAEDAEDESGDGDGANGKDTDEGDGEVKDGPKETEISEDDNNVDAQSEKKPKDDSTGDEVMDDAEDEPGDHNDRTAKKESDDKVTDEVEDEHKQLVRERIDKMLEQESKIEDALRKFFTEGQNETLFRFCKNNDYNSMYGKIRLRVVNHERLHELQKLQPSPSGFTEEESKEANDILTNYDATLKQLKAKEMQSNKASSVKRGRSLSPDATRKKAKRRIGKQSNQAYPAAYQFPIPNYPMANLDAQQQFQLNEFNSWLIKWNDYQFRLAHYYQERFKFMTNSNDLDESDDGEDSKPSAIKSGWKKRYDELIEYKAEHGSTNVPFSFTYKHKPPLGVWVKRMRALYRKGTLPMEKVEALQSIGFEFEPDHKNQMRFSIVWDKSYQALKEFYETNGHVEVPDGYKPTPNSNQLDQWIKRQRTLYRQKKLPQDLIKKLQDISVNLEKRGKPYGIQSMEPMEAWLIHFGWLENYKNEHGDCDVPEKYERNQFLGDWVKAQRELHVAGKLPEERVHHLNNIGFHFWRGRANEKKMSSDPWMMRCQELQAYKKQHGHFNVPRIYPANFALGTWLHNQRIAYAEGQLSEERLKHFQDIDFKIGQPVGEKKKKGGKKQWDRRYDDLVAFQNEHGHCNVPYGFEDDPSLGAWVKRQKRYYRDKVMKPERIQLLRDIGFQFAAKRVKSEVQPKSWEEKYEELVSFHDEFGHVKVPANHKDNQSLYMWLGSQRQRFKKGTLSKERMQLLTDLGFDFSHVSRVRKRKTTTKDVKVTDPQEWDAKLQLLKEYKEKFGNCDVPQRYKKGRLGAWVHLIRHYKKLGRLTDENIQSLTNLGFKFNILQSKWKLRYDELVNFKNEYGHCDVPFEYDKELGQWVYQQRKYTSRLTKERIDLLAKIDFNFEPNRLRIPTKDVKETKSDEVDQQNEVWATRYNDLIQYKSEHKDCNVPATYDPNPFLAKWCSMQRIKYKQGSLSEEYKKKLEEIGFDFDTTAQYKPKGPELEDREVYLQKLWDSNFEELKNYKDKHGNADIPIHYEGNQSLGAWAFSQRMAYKKKKLSDDRFNRLNELGFQF